MSLKETYVSNVVHVPPRDRVFVMRHRGHDALAPPEELFRDFKDREAALKTRGLSPVDAHNQAWDDVRYEERFGAAFWANAAAVTELTAILKRAASEDVWLVCYEKPPKKCHRFLLLEYARKLV
jgi:hypothetical protein